MAAFVNSCKKLDFEHVQGRYNNNIFVYNQWNALSDNNISMICEKSYFGF